MLNLLIMTSLSSNEIEHNNMKSFFPTVAKTLTATNGTNIEEYVPFITIGSVLMLVGIPTLICFLYATYKRRQARRAADDIALNGPQSNLEQTHREATDAADTASALVGAVGDILRAPSNASTYDTFPVI